MCNVSYLFGLAKGKIEMLRFATVEIENDELKRFLKSSIKKLEERNLEIFLSTLTLEKKEEELHSVLFAIEELQRTIDLKIVSSGEKFEKLKEEYSLMNISL